jgi:ATP-dependent Clp protease adaptor protein ClpS
MPVEKTNPPAPVPVRSMPEEGQGSVVVERQAAKTEPPPMYQVILLNDDYTPMEFVVWVLQEYFVAACAVSTPRTSPSPKSNWC